MDFISYYKYKSTIDENRYRNDFNCAICGKSTYLRDAELLKSASNTSVVGYERRGAGSVTTYKTTYHNYRICKECNNKVIKSMKRNFLISSIIAITFILITFLIYWFTPYLSGIFGDIQSRNFGSFIGWGIGIIIFSFFIIFVFLFLILDFFSPKIKITFEEAIKKNAID